MSIMVGRETVHVVYGGSSGGIGSGWRILQDITIVHVYIYFLSEAMQILRNHLSFEAQAPPINCPS